MARIPAPSHRVCAALGCDDRLPKGSRSDRVYCSQRCSRRMAVARRRRRERLDEGLPPTRTDIELARLEAIEEHARLNAIKATESLTDATPTPPPAPPAGGKGLKPTSLIDTSKRAPTPAASTGGARRGAVYASLVDSGIARQIDLGHMSQAEAAKSLGVSKSAISRAMDAYAVDRRQAAINEDHRLTPAQRDLLSDYRLFSEHFFPEIDTPGFHLEWEEALDRAIDTGHRHLLMAPQRHGKSTFLLHTVLRRIIANPDLCVLWVGKTKDLASQMTGYLRQLLENDDRLKQEFLPPGSEFQPPSRSGLPWRNDEFTLSTRTRTQKSATVTAIGAGGTILGRDADLIIIDDPVDRAMCLSPTEREKIEEWFFTDFISRKMEHTGVVYIGSRQHHQDLPGEIVRRNNESISNGFAPDWSVSIYRSHDPNCAIERNPARLDDPDRYDDHVDCVLWPTHRSFAWLMGQRRANPEHFERNYQNNPSSDAFIAVTQEDIEASFDLDVWYSTSSRSEHYPNVWDLPAPRVVGQAPPGTRLVASIDPATAKPNAAVLWAYTATPHPVPDPDGGPPVLAPIRAIVDIKETPRPGSPGILNLINDWYAKYHVVEWIFETNIYSDQIKNDSSLADVRSRYGLKYHTHHTSAVTKHDPVAGVLAMLAQMRKRPTGILLPGGDDLSKRRLNRLTFQMLNFDPEISGGGSRRSSADDDLIMAMWFGWYWLERNSRIQSQRISYKPHFQFKQSTHTSDFGLSWNRPPSSWSAA